MKKFEVIDVRANPADSAFLIDDGSVAVLCDSGFGFTGYAVADNIKKHLKNRTLDAVLLTHSHYDHALGSPYIKRRFPETKIVASEYAAKIFSKEGAKAVMRDLDRKFAKTCGVTDYECLADELSADVIVNDGDRVRFGSFEFEVISLPGHTRCSVGYFCESAGLFVPPETLGVFDGNENFLPSALVGIGLTLDSFRRAGKINAQYVLSPHFGLLPDALSAMFLKKSEKTATEVFKNIENMLKSGKEKSEILAYFENEFYSDYVKKIYPRDAMELNTGIMIDLIEKELMQRGENL